MNARRVLPGWPVHSATEIEIVGRILARSVTNSVFGSEARSFESEFAGAVGCDHGVCVANGTLALEILLEACGIGAGDEVIVPARTFLATASAVVRRGGIPVFCDVDPYTGNIDPTAASRLITVNTRALLCVHLNGLPCDMDALGDLARTHGLLLLEDCAQAHGASVGERPAGSFGDGAAWSFCYDKIISTGGEGGMITTTNTDLAKAAASLINHGEGGEPRHEDGFVWKRDRIGTNARLTEMQAAIGRAQLRQLPGWIAKRNRNAAVLVDAIKELPGVHLNEPGDGVVHARYRFEFHFDGARDRLLGDLNAYGIKAGIGPCPEIYREGALADTDAVPAARLPAAMAYGRTSVALPVHPSLEPADMAWMADRLRQAILDHGGHA